VGDLSEDQVAQSLADRLACGGLSSSVTEAEAKKRGFQVAKSVKLINKGKDEIVLVGPAEVAKEPAIKNTPKVLSKPV
jgi:hypothetical protein